MPSAIFPSRPRLTHSLHLHQGNLESSAHPGLLWNLMKSFGFFQRTPGLILNAEKGINETWNQGNAQGSKSSFSSHAPRKQGQDSVLLTFLAPRSVGIMDQAMTSQVLDVYESDFINLFPYQELSFPVILIRTENSLLCPLRSLLPQEQLLNPTDIFFQLRDDFKKCPRNKDTGLKQTKKKKPNHKQEHPTKNFIRKNFCRAGNSPTNLSFYSGDIMNHFQLKYLLRSKSKGKKCV